MNDPKFVVYEITYSPTAQYYVGSTQEKTKRWNRHRYELRKGNHHNAHMRRITDVGYVARHWSFAVVATHHTLDEARAEEARRIRLGRGSCSCFNIGRHASGGDNLSAHPDKESIIARRSAAQRKAYGAMSAEERSKKWGRPGAANPMAGRTHTAAARAAVSKANSGVSRNKGCKRSNAVKAAMSERASLRTGIKNPFYGRAHSPETKAKLSAANKGRKPVNQRPVVVDGTTHEGVTAAARLLGVSPALVIYRIKSKKWEYHYL